MIIFVLLVLLETICFADDPTNNLGLSTLWKEMRSWFNNSYVPHIFALMCFATGIERAVEGSVIQFFMMLALAVAFSQGINIIDAIVPSVGF